MGNSVEEKLQATRDSGGGARATLTQLGRMWGWLEHVETDLRGRPTRIRRVPMSGGAVQVWRRVADQVDPLFEMEPPPSPAVLEQARAFEEALG